jgi:hypothetical protein
VHGQHQDQELRGLRLEGFHELEAAHLPQDEIDDDDVGSGGGQFLQGLFGRGGIAADHEVGGLIDQFRQSLSDDSMIVHQEDSPLPAPGIFRRLRPDHARFH